MQEYKQPFINFTFEGSEEVKNEVFKVLNFHIPEFLGFMEQEAKSLNLDYINAVSIAKQGGSLNKTISEFGQRLQYHSTKHDMQAIEEISKNMINKYTSFQQMVFQMRRVNKLFDEVQLYEQSKKAGQKQRTDYWNIVKYTEQMRGNK